MPIMTFKRGNHTGQLVFFVCITR